MLLCSLFFFLLKLAAKLEAPIGIREAYIDKKFRASSIKSVVCVRERGVTGMRGGFVGGRRREGQTRVGHGLGAVCMCTFVC